MCKGTSLERSTWRREVHVVRAATPGRSARMGRVFHLRNIGKRRTFKISLFHRVAKIDFELQGRPLNPSIRKDSKNEPGNPAEITTQKFFCYTNSIEDTLLSGYFFPIS